MQSRLPWTSDFERALYKAAFDDNADAALRAAQLWFSKVDTDKVSYEHHRLIAAVGRRFDTATALQDRRTMFRNVSKQLWLRAVHNLRDAETVCAVLRSMRIPHAHAGHAVWLGHKTNLFLDCEQIEIVAHENALGLVLRTLCEHGWYPHERYHFDKADKKIALQGPRGVRLTLFSAGALRDLTGQTNADFWTETRGTTAFGQKLRTLSPRQNLRLWRLRSDDPLQALIDCSILTETDLRPARSGLAVGMRFGLWRIQKNMARALPERGTL
jgi:hypothetical protein